jgi:tRNA pseudouridine55 synthase
MNGIINFHKPPGITSHDGVNLLRRLTGIKRIGHTGTLDPMASGVLPLCIGNAARIVEYLADDDKKYVCELRLGFRSDTLDIWGNVLNTDWDNWNSLSHNSVSEVINSFIGKQEQIPPAYSAIKVNGRKLYEYAREGTPVTVPPRLVEIFNIRIIAIDLETRSISLEISCSKGTYIRSLCDSIGDRLGCGAVMSGLRRTASGSFRIENALTVEELSNAFSDKANPPMHLLSATDVPLMNFPKVDLDIAETHAFINGVKLNLEGSKMPEGLYRVYGELSLYDRQQMKEQTIFLGVGYVNADILSAKKVLYKSEKLDK